MTLPRIHTLAPLLALALLAVGGFLPLNAALVAVSVAALIASVVSGVHHAEVIAHRVGEPFGTLVLALAVTVIEVALILSLMLVGGPAKAALARDAVYAAIMIITNGVVGICLLVGGLRYGEQAFRKDSSGPALAALAALATLSLVLPVFTTSAPGPYYSTSQLVFAALASLALWGAYVLFQTVGHRDYFLPPAGRGDPEVHAAPPTAAEAWRSFALLLVALLAVVGLAKRLSPGVEAGLASAGAPPMVAGIVISLIVLLPETWAAVRAAHADRLQSSMNLALGSALATIGLTIPAVVAIALALDLPLELGLGAKDIVLLFLTLLVAGFTLGAGRTTVMQGAVHLVLFAAFLFLALVP
jgi:Ca2+:H+ antiporter